MLGSSVSEIFSLLHSLLRAVDEGISRGTKEKWSVSPRVYVWLIHWFDLVFCSDACHRVRARWNWTTQRSKTGISDELFIPLISRSASKYSRYQLKKSCSLFENMYDCGCYTDRSIRKANERRRIWSNRCLIGASRWVGRMLTLVCRAGEEKRQMILFAMINTTQQDRMSNEFRHYYYRR